MRPPQHSIDARPTLVLGNEANWDLDRIVSELEGHDEADKDRHPFRVYMSGESRYDLTAKHDWKGGSGTAQEYLQPGAVFFHLRRHRLDHMAEVQDAVEREVNDDGSSAFLAIWLKSARYGISAISGDESIEWEGAGTVPERIMRTIMDEHGGLEAIAKIGAAAWMISKPLGSAEKKR